MLINKHTRQADIMRHQTYLPLHKLIACTKMHALWHSNPGPPRENLLQTKESVHYNHWSSQPSGGRCSPLDPVPQLRNTFQPHITQTHFFHSCWLLSGLWHHWQPNARPATAVIIVYTGTYLYSSSLNPWIGLQGHNYYKNWQAMLCTRQQAQIGPHSLCKWLPSQTMYRPYF